MNDEGKDEGRRMKDERTAIHPSSFILHPSDDPSPADLRGGLASRSFLGLLATQFLGALNDNMFRWLVVPIGMGIIGNEEALSLGIVCFTLPYLLFATFAGFLADRFDKRAVIVACKAAEIVLMSLAVLGIFLGNIYFLFFVVGLMGTQSALFGPSKFGSIPEILTADKISSANGLMGLVTVVASALGTFAGYQLYAVTHPDLSQAVLFADIWPAAAALIGVAVVGWLTSLMIMGLPAADPQRKLPPNPVVETGRNLALLARNVPLLRTALGIAFFWFLASLAQVNINTFGIDILKLQEQEIGALLVVLVAGVGIGSVLAGLWSGGKVELGIVPLGAMGIAVSSLLLFFTGNSVDGSVVSGQSSVVSGDSKAEVRRMKDEGSAIHPSSFILHPSADNVVARAPDRATASTEGLQNTIGRPAVANGAGSGDPRTTVTTDKAYWWSCLWLFTLGMSAGLFNIPLEAYLQHRSDVQTRGIILAASNFVSFTFILSSAGFFYILQKMLGLSSAEIFLVAGLGTVPVVVYAFSLLPQATIRFLVWLASHTVYRVRVYGRENLPETGGALLVANHISWLDGVLLLLTSSRPIRMLAYADYTELWGLRWLARTFGVIPIKAEGGPKALLRSLNTAREAVQRGELVCIFAEGQISRTGQLQPFQRGMMRIVEGTGAPVIPVYLDELWGSIFSYSGGRFFWKWPKRWPYPVSIFFGKPLSPWKDEIRRMKDEGSAIHPSSFILHPSSVHAVQQAVQNLGVQAVQERNDLQSIPTRRFLRNARRSRFRSKIADTTGQELTSGRVLTGALAFKRLLERSVIAPDEEMVGILLPPSVGGVIANASVSLMGKVAVDLNYTLSNEDVNYCIRQAKIKHVLTSRRFLEKRPFEMDAEVVFLEDLKEQVTTADRVFALFQAYVTPLFILERRLGLTKVQPDDLLTVIFTSGSTGEPKGVMLSHRNVASNIDAVDQLFHIKPTDVLMGVLPFFHSFGYTGTLWLTLTLECKTVFHFNPLDAREIGKLSKKHGTTIIMATPTFLRTYLKRCSPEDFSKLNLVVVGAEKLPLDLARGFQEKFGVEPTEGYGTTELSPVAAFNVPPNRAGAAAQPTTKLGTVGRVMPGAAARIVDPETWADLGTNKEGLLLIKGPNVMLGYLNMPEKTAEVIRDGWYNTGDFAKIDEQGFIEITGRQSRFAKIGGEMVPHLKIEEAIARIVEDAEEAEPSIQVAVTSVPDEKKGERLVVLHKPLKKSVDQILKQLAESDLPNLWLPGRDSFIEVEEIPILGTGKLDLKRVNLLAREMASHPKAEQPAEK